MTLIQKIGKYVKIQIMPRLLTFPQPPEPLFGEISRDKGKTVLLHNGAEMRFISVIEFKEGFGSRGNHFHKRKHEFIFVLSGKARAQFWLPGIPEENIVTVVERGHFIYVKPGCAHAYTPLVDMAVVEFSPQSFDSADEYDSTNLAPIVEDGKK